MGFIKKRFGNNNKELWDSAIIGDAVKVQVQIDAGADVKAQDKKGATALIKASIHGHNEVVQALIGAGADVNTQNKDGISALMMASNNGHRKVVKIIKDSDHAAQMSELEIIKKLLKQSKGARDFTQKIISTKGFKILTEDLIGITVQGKNCKFIYSVLDSFGSDNIFSLVYKEGDGPTIALVDEGRIEF